MLTKGPEKFLKSATQEVFSKIIPQKHCRNMFPKNVPDKKNPEKCSQKVFPKCKQNKVASLYWMFDNSGLKQTKYEKFLCIDLQELKKDQLHTMYILVEKCLQSQELLFAMCN